MSPRKHSREKRGAHRSRRRYVVTGAASGIGKATCDLLEARGDVVIGIDLRGSDLDADLSTHAGRDGLRDAVVEALGGTVDAIIAVAGLAIPSPATVQVNYFGTIATLEMLRPLLSGSAAPRAALVASVATVGEVDADLVDLLRLHDESGSISRVNALMQSGRLDLIYSSSKRGIAEWMRERSISPEWAGAGIPLNAVGPGIVLTPMTEELLSTPEGRTQLMQTVPMPLHGPAPAKPSQRRWCG